MIDVTCFQCRSKVRISPAAYECPKCEQDLRQLLSQEQVSGYFYNRASALAANGEFQAALEEVEHGLSFYGSSELHLLAAILSQQLGRYDQMRHHVAAIPLEDSLRSEAEWLLRSHQDRQRTLREGLKVDRNVRRGGIQANRAIVVDELSGKSAGATPAAVWRVGFLRLFAVTSVVLFSLVVLLVAASELFPEETDQLWALVTFSSRPGANGSPGAGGDPTAANGDPVGESGLDPDAVSVLPSEEGDPARRLIIQAPDPAAVESAFVQAGREDLLELALTLRIEEGRALVQGVAQSASQRQALAELLPTVPGVEQVDLSGLELVFPATYVVQPGDTLWTIVFNIYGDVERLDDVIEANRDILPSPDALQPGMELQIPPP
jgi:hypothetical protein